MAEYAVEVIRDDGWTFPLLAGIARREDAEFAVRQLNKTFPALGGTRLLAPGFRAVVREKERDE